MQKIDTQERLTKELLYDSPELTMSGVRLKRVVKMLKAGTVTVIDGVAYTAEEMALFKLWILENMIDRGDLIDITTFDNAFNMPEEIPPELDDEGTFIAVVED